MERGIDYCQIHLPIVIETPVIFLGRNYMSVEIIRLGSEYALPLPANKLGESPICTPDGMTLYYVDVPVG